MYNIIEQHQNQSSKGTELATMMLNDSTKSIPPVLTTTSGGFKIDCAKECPCNVPVIPVPDQFLEVMVTGGFKVWHIIFIIIAFVVTIIVVYCCFHRCRIPRTKQEIEADLMRTNLTAKFRDYLQEFPNEPTTFLEALKKVQELEERWANEQDDTGAKKRMGWLKLRGKDKGAGGGASAPDAASGELAGKEATDGSAPGPELAQPLAEPASQQQQQQQQQQQPAHDERVVEPSATTTAGPTTITTSKDRQPTAGATISIPTSSMTNESTKKKRHTSNNNNDNNLNLKTTLTLKQPLNENASGDGGNVKPDKLSGQHKDTTAQVPKKPLAADLKSARMAHVSDRASLADKERQASFAKLERPLPPSGSSAEATTKSHKTKAERATKQRGSAAVMLEGGPVGAGAVAGKMVAPVVAMSNEQNVDMATTNAASLAAASNRPAKTRRKRDKPNLSRTKAAHVGSRGESIEASSTNVLAIPVASHRRPHHHHHHQHDNDPQQKQLDTDGQQQLLFTNKPDPDPPLEGIVTINSSHREARTTDKPHSNRQTRTTKRGDSTIIHIENIDSGPK